MAATIGTGNIVGVATAVVAGGPGAFVLMIVAACSVWPPSMQKAYWLSSSERIKAGKIFEALSITEKGMGKKWSWLAKIFAVFAVGAGLLGIGTITQVNGIASATKGFFRP